MKMLNITAVLLLLLAACAPTHNWISTPPKQTFDSELVHVEFAPQKKAQTYYDAFLITVVNKTDEPLQIDWNRTHYLLNGKTYDRFVFLGVTREDINNLPPDVIPSEETFSKIIFPLNLIAWKPYKSGDKSAPSFSPGPIPAGENGISLAIDRGKELIRPKLVVRIRQTAQ